MRRPNPMAPDGPDTVGPDDPEMVVTELWGHATGFLRSDWENIRHDVFDGQERPVVDSLGTVPMTVDYAQELAAHEQVEDVWFVEAASVETTTRGELPGTIVNAEVETEDAVFTVTFAGRAWFSWHPTWLDEGLAEQEDGDIPEGLCFYETFEDYVNAMRHGTPGGMTWDKTAASEVEE